MIYMAPRTALGFFPTQRNHPAWTGKSDLRGTSDLAYRARSSADSRFDDSACVLLNAKGEMMGTRISGPVSATLREIEGNQPGGKWAKILAVAPKVS